MTTPSITRLQATATVDAIVDALDRDGAVIIENLIDQATVATIRGELQPWLEITPPGEGLFFGRRTVRFGGVITKAPTSQQLCLNPLALGAAEAVLKQACTSIQLNLSQAIAIGPNEPEQVLHGDDEMWMNPRAGTEYMVNAMWALTDFTKENGATRVIPGSHRGPVRRAADPSEIAYAEMPAGSLILWRGSALHGGGANQTNEFRVGVVMSYCLGWLRQAENQYLVAPPEVAKSMPAQLRKLIGYSIHEPSVGHFEGQDPSVIFEDGALKQPLPFRDHLPQWAEAELKAYYGLAAE